MKQISNSMLALMVVMSIVISALGTFLSINKIGQTGWQYTGMATGTARANLTVPQIEGLEIFTELIQLGSIIPSNGSINYSNDSEAKQSWWGVKNTGTTNISIRIYSNSGTDDQIGASDTRPGRGPFTAATGSTAGDCMNSSDLSRRCFMVHCYNVSFSTGTAWPNCNATYEALPLNGGTGGGSTSRILLSKLGSETANSTAYFGVNVTIPKGETSGDKLQNVVIYSAIVP
jgi:hypothetical protein